MYSQLDRTVAAQGTTTNGIYGSFLFYIEKGEDGGNNGPRKYLPISLPYSRNLFLVLTATCFVAVVTWVQVLMPFHSVLFQAVRKKKRDPHLASNVPHFLCNDVTSGDVVFTGQFEYSSAVPAETNSISE